MALLTPLTDSDAARVADSYRLGRVLRVEPLAAGSVNSNFVLTTERGRFFLRVYEEQQAEGVAFEWRLLDHLSARGIAVPQRLVGPAPGELTVASKPTGLFELVGGFERCRRQVEARHISQVGEALARVHLASEGFALASRDRFDAASLIARIDGVSLSDHPELASDVARIKGTLASIAPSALPKGIVHGDLFRDNVRWEGDRLAALLDWESASCGVLAFDVMVVCLAWCWTDTLEWTLARSFARAYHGVRPLTGEERLGLGEVARLVCARFAATRVTDFYLRGGPGSPEYRDYKRFLARLDLVESMAEGELAARLID